MRRGMVVAIALATGCKGGTSVGADFFGKAPGPPGKLAVLRAGMTFDVARAALPDGARLDPTGAAIVATPTGHAGVHAEIAFRASKLDRITLRVDTSTCDATLAAAWGPPHAGTAVTGRPERYWLNERDGWKVAVKTDQGCMLELERHEPVTAEFFGPSVAPPADLTRVHIGMSVDEAKRAAPELVPAPVRARVHAHDHARDQARDHAPDQARMLLTSDKPGPSDVHAFVEEGDHGRIEHLGLALKAHALPALERAWGKPTRAPDGDLVWEDPDAGWRAHAAVEADQDFVLLFDRAGD